MKKLTVIYMTIMVLVTGCGSIQRQQEANYFAQFSGPESGSTVDIVSVGAIQAQSSSQKGGAAFGLIGALIEAAATSESSQNKGEAITSALVQEKIDDYLAKQTLLKLNACNVTGSISPSIVNKTDKEWSQSLNTVVTNPKSIKANYIVELGAPTFVIYDGLASTKICGAATAKVFRASDGMLVNKVRATNQNGLLCNHSLSHYSDSDKEKFEELKKVTKEALDEIAGKLSQQICRTKEG